MQSKIKKTALATALATALTGGALMSVSTAVQAVNIAQDGLGEALVFPYYTVRGGWSTLFNITNTSNETVIIKVRWREALNSRDVRDFHVILSPYDTWTAVTKINAGGAEIVTTDNSCTYPELKTTRDLDGSSFGDGLTGKTFTNRAYVLDKTGANWVDNRDSKNNTPVSVFAGSSGPVSPLKDEAAPNPNLDRAREGYFEVFNMGSISNARPDMVDGTVLSNQAQIIDATTIAKYAKHQEEVSDNKARPRDCTLVRSVLRNRGTTQINRFLNEPKNVLKGRAILVKGAEGIAAGYDPLVLADWRDTSAYDEPSTRFPNLNGTDPFAIVINDGQVTPTRSAPILSATESVPLLFDTSASFTAGADAVSALISRSNVINDYNIKSGSATSWVLSFPTKNFYVDEKLYSTNNQSPIQTVGLAPLAPFATAGASAFDARSCFSFRLSLWDREEYNVIADQFSPRIPPDGRGMCYETNILSFGKGANLFNSTVINRAVVGGNNKKSLLPAQSGWAMLGFGPGGFNGTSSGSGVDSVYSLPVLGTRIEVRNRGDATVNYGLANKHVYVGDRTKAGLNQAVTWQ